MAARSEALLTAENLLEDVLASLNAGELARRRFREVARVSGLIFQGYPGAPQVDQAAAGELRACSTRCSASTTPVTSCWRRPSAKSSSRNWTSSGCTRRSARMRAQSIVYRLLSRPSPFAFPLMIERLREQVTTEKLGARIERMIADLERAAAA